MQRPKPFVLTDSFKDGSFSTSKPIVMRWNGTDMPEVLRKLKPGQYVVLPFEPSNEAVQSAKEAA